MTPESRKNRRGSVLIGSLLVSMILAGLAYYSFDVSQQAMAESQRGENYAKARAAAEYGAELAISELGNVTRDPDTAVVLGDWVSANYFEAPLGGRSKDQRRIGGGMDDQEFRVRVRSVRDAYINNTMPDGWLVRPDDYDSDPGSLGRYSYGNMYEITSTARNAAVGSRGWVNPLMYPEATVRTVVTLGNNDTRGTANDVAALHTEEPANFRPTNVAISGEDTYLNKFNVSGFTNTISTPLKLDASEANFFGALGGYWANGCLTLNFQNGDVVNPFRPQTSVFSPDSWFIPDNPDRTMIRYDEGRPADEYLLGGKQSRTVSLLENEKIKNNPKIKETSASQAGQGGAFNVVLGAFEDLPRLYINMAGITNNGWSYGADSTYPKTRKDWWFQQYIGQYTSIKKTTTNAAVAWPLDNKDQDARIRCQTVHFLLNADSEMLVREYEKDGKLYNYAISGGKWTKNYAWAKWQHSASTFRLKGNTSQYIHPRMFQWQELLGFSLAKRDGGEPAINEDGNKNANVNNENFKTYYPKDVNGNPIKKPVGFDEEFQQAPGRILQDRNDPIMVRQPDGSLRAYRTMNDFLVEKNFGTATEPNMRDALALSIGYEDQPEGIADYNYSDMMFTIWISPGEEEEIRNEEILGKTNLHWWEVERDTGLTGRKSHESLSTNKDPSTVSSLDPTKDNYGLLNHGGGDQAAKEALDEQLYTMVDADGNAVTFPRAIFGTDGENLGVLMNPPGIGEANVRYYSPDDLILVMQRELLGDPNHYLKNPDGSDMTEPQRKERALLDMRENNPTVAFRPVGERWNDYEKSKAGDGSDPGADGVRKNAYRVTKKDVLVREYAGRFIGTMTVSVPTLKTRHDLSPMGEDPAPENQALEFMAGEFLQKAGEASLAGDPDHVPFTSVELERQPDGTATPIQKFLAPMSGSGADGMSAAAAAAVAMCYRPFDPAAYSADADYPHRFMTAAAYDSEIKKLYGDKESRYSIGFHRGGVDSSLAAKYLQDHFEIATLGIAGFNPYYETVAGVGRYIASAAVSDDDPSSGHYPVEKAGGDAPTFVFDKPIDGAGVLIVNGNLTIRNTFAYSGTLLVLGDLLVDPQLVANEPAYGQDGMPFDKYGHSLDEDAQGHFYVNEKNEKVYWEVDADGKPVHDSETGKRIPVAPVMNDKPKGELVVQGDLMVEGKVATNTLNYTDKDGVEQSATGKIAVMWSSQAIEEAQGITGGGAGGGSNYAIRRVVWAHNDGIDARSMWANAMD